MYNNPLRVEQYNEVELGGKDGDLPHPLLTEDRVRVQLDGAAQIGHKTRVDIDLLIVRGEELSAPQALFDVPFGNDLAVTRCRVDLVAP